MDDVLQRKKGFAEKRDENWRKTDSFDLIIIDRKNLIVRNGLRLGGSVERVIEN